MMLSDRDIKYQIAAGEIEITPFNPEQLQPSSYDVTLGKDIKLLPIQGQVIDPITNTFHTPVLDPRQDNSGHFIEAELDGGPGCVLMPGVLCLGVLQERIKLGSRIAAQIAGKSSIGRLGLAIHVTAGFVDPGWDGHLTLEMVNQTSRPIRLYPGMKIGQCVFFMLVNPAERPYGHPELGSKYQGSTTATESKMHANYWTDAQH